MVVRLANQYDNVADIVNMILPEGEEPVSLLGYQRSYWLEISEESTLMLLLRNF